MSSSPDAYERMPVAAGAAVMVERVRDVLRAIVLRPMESLLPAQLSDLAAGLTGVLRSVAREAREAAERASAGAESRRVQARVRE